MKQYHLIKVGKGVIASGNSTQECIQNAFMNDYEIDISDIKAMTEIQDPEKEVIRDAYILMDFRHALFAGYLSNQT